LDLSKLPTEFIWLTSALSLITNIVTFVGLFRNEMPEVDWSMKTRDQYGGHIKSLARSQHKPLITPIPDGKVRMLSRYFAVSKKNLTARAIWNGKRLSARQTPPDPVNLPEIPEVLKKAAEIHRDIQSKSPNKFAVPSILAIDFRHWFHQIEVDANIGEFFAICCMGQCYAWRGLPMGWSHSPRIAQCVSWSIILASGVACLATEVEMAKRSVHPPSYIFTRDEAGMPTGIIFIWYDNIVAMIWSAQHFRDVQRGILAECLRVNAQLSACKVWPSSLLRSGLAQEGEECPHFLGVEVSIECRRERDGKHTSVFRWRPESAFRAKARDLSTLFQSAAAAVEQGQPAAQPSCRLVAKAVGLAIWNAYVRDTPMLEEIDIIDIARKNVPAANGPRKKAWDHPSTISTEDISALIKKLRVIELEGWSRLGLPLEPLDKFILVTDSSGHTGAYVVLDYSGRTLESDAWKWDGKMRTASIFLKELLAATLAIEKCSAKDARVHLLCDNSAAACVIRRGMSIKAEANEMLRRIFKAMPRARLLTTTIRSEDNAADPLTRSKPLCTGRIGRSMRCALDAEQGWIKTESKPKYHSTQENSDSDLDARHAEEDEEDANLDSLFAVMHVEDENDSV
jgi:hypothetical protein